MGLVLNNEDVHAAPLRRVQSTKPGQIMMIAGEGGFTSAENYMMNETRSRD